MLQAYGVQFRPKKVCDFCCNQRSIEGVQTVDQDYLMLLHTSHHRPPLRGDNLKRLGPFLVAIAAFFWGISGGVGAVLTSNGWSGLLLAFARGAVGLLFVLVWLAIRPDRKGLSSPALWGWSLLAGVGVGGNFSFYFISIGEGSVAVAATLMYCAPVYVYLISFALKLEQPSAVKWAAIVTVLLGVVLLTGLHDMGASTVTPLGVGTGLLAGMSYAVFIFAFKYAAPHGKPQTILAVAFAVLCLLLAWPADVQQMLAVGRSADWPLFMLLGVLGAGVSFILYLQGLHYTAPAIAAVVAMLEPVTASLFGLAVLEQSLGGLQWVGMVLILVAVTALSVYSSRRSGDGDQSG